MIHKICVVCVLLACGHIRALATPQQWSGNGHWYELIYAPGIPWDNALKEAQSRSYMGFSGYLATLTSAEEDQFVLGLINNSKDPGQYYAGGYQDAGVTPADFGWKWVTGESWNYTNWSSGEPNDHYGPASEQWLGVGWSGWYWNDEAALGNIKGYVVEYGSVPEQGPILGLFAFVLVGLMQAGRRQN